MFNLCNNVTIRQVNINNNYFGYAILILNPFGTFEVLNTRVSEGLGGILCSDLCPGSGIAAIFKNKGKSTNESYVQVIIKETIFQSNANKIHNIPAISSLTKYEACQLPAVGAGGLTVIFTQTDYIANFTTTQSTIGYFNYGSVAGGMLILFLNNMKQSQVFITNTHFHGGGLLLDTNQVGGSDITIHSFMCGNCSSDTTDSPRSHPIYFDTVHIDDLNDPRLLTIKLQYGGVFYVDIHESCTNDFKQFFLTKLMFIIHFRSSFQPGMYVVVRSPKAEHSIVLKSCHFRQHSSSIASLYSSVAAMTFVN